MRYVASHQEGRYEVYAAGTWLAAYDSYEAALYHAERGEPPTPAALADWQAGRAATSRAALAGLRARLGRWWRGAG